MGLLGSGLGKVIGGGLGEIAGGMIGGKHGAKIGGGLGSVLGGAGGALLPFKKGGKVTKKTQPALLHQGEIVVPKALAHKVPASLKKEMKKKGARNM